MEPTGSPGGPTALPPPPTYPPPPGYQPPVAWAPPPPRAGLPGWAIALIIVVVVLVLLGALAVVFVFMTGIIVGTPPSRPIVTFSQSIGITNGFEFEVAGVSQTRPAANFRVGFSVNGTSAGAAQTLAAMLTFTGDMYGSTYAITWTDIGGEGDLSRGDVFRITRSGGLLPSTEYQVFLLWIDGSQLQSASYLTP